MDRPKGFRDTFSRPHLVQENERASNTITQIHEVIQNCQAQTLNLQRQLSSMRTDGESSLEAQTKVIERITRNNKSLEDMGQQIGTVQTLIEFNRTCVSYIDWLRGETRGARH